MLIVALTIGMADKFKLLEAQLQLLQTELGELRKENQHLREVIKFDNPEEKEYTFRLLAENSTDLISRHSYEGTILYATPSFESVLGYKSEELIGTNPYDYFHPDDVQYVKNSHAIIVKKPVEDILEYRMRHKKGHYVWVETIIKSLFDKEGHIIEIHSTSRDITLRKRAQIDLDESQRMLEAVIDCIPVRVFWKDKNSILLGGNALFVSDTNVHSTKEVIGISAIDVGFDPAEAETYRLDDLKVMTTGIPKINYEELQTNHKGLRWMNVSKVPLKNSKGEIIGILGAYDDITERKKTEQALFESEQRLKAIIHNAPLVLFIINKEGVFTFSDGKGLEKLGLQPGEVVGQSFRDIYKDYPNIIRNVDLALSGLSVQQNLYIGDIVFETQFTPVLDGRGNIESIIGVSTDISERVKSDQALVESEEKFRLLAENLTGVIYMCKNDRKWTTIYMNESIYKLVGYPKEQFYNEEISLADIYHPDDKDRVYTEVNNSLSANLPFHLIYRIIHANGSIIWIEEVGDAIRKNGKIQYLEGYMSDITNLKNTEEKLKNINVDLEKKVIERTVQFEMINKELSEFAYVVSHDLKAPLRGISQLAEWLIMDYAEALGKEGFAMIELMKGRVNRLENLINAILQYSRIGRQAVKDELVDINKVVKETIDLLSPPMNISIEVVTQLPEMMINKIRIGQVFQNLIGNAIKFMDKGIGYIQIGHEENGEELLFYVIDNGPGIDKKYFDKIFQIFQTLTSRDEKESTGVGLALVKKIVELYGGTIWIESEKDKGSTFKFKLPKTKNT